MDYLTCLVYLNNGRVISKYTMGNIAMSRVICMALNVLVGAARDRRGSVATFLAATIIPLVAFCGLAVDTSRGYLMKSRLSYALDAAALAGGRVMYDATLRDAMINKFFSANFPNNYMGAAVTGPMIAVDDVNHTITVDATATMGTSLMRVLGFQTMDVAANTEVKLSARTLEVSVVLDVTGSMSGSKIADLKTAATDLVNIVVQDMQSPFYSKAALIPFSVGVNVGGYASQVRGPIAAAIPITGATKANPAVITAANHGFVNGDKVYITGIGGMTNLNNKFYIVANATTNTFSLRNESNTSNIDSSSWSAYSSGGNAWCTVYGCQYFRYTDTSNSLRTANPSNCVTERTGVNAYTDVAPSTSYVGKHYESSSSCPSSQIVPLTSDKTLLANSISALAAGGTTAGHIGAAWGWYLLAPDFAYLWPSASQPGAYNDPSLLKVAIFMTDGEFNTMYYQGVTSKDSTGSPRINQNATNGNSFAQAQDICSAMKAENIEVYTVGFQVGSIQNAIDFLSACATDPAHAYLAADGAELQTVFHTIAMNIAQLRLSK